MLRIGLSALDQGPVDTEATVAPDDQLFAGLDFSLSEPVHITGQLSAAGPGSYYWRGKMHTAIEATCRRCLAGASLRVDTPVNILFTEDDQADDPSVYPLEPRSRTVDLSTAIREELILAVPDYVLCREDCAGLCPHCGQDLNEGAHQCPAAPADPRWAGLEALKQKPSPKDR
jgi:uncharacterized protein